eukprot:2532413-Pyramimonas_sp.AAC.1
MVSRWSPDIGVPMESTALSGGANPAIATRASQEAQKGKKQEAGSDMGIPTPPPNPVSYTHLTLPTILLV